MRVGRRQFVKLVGGALAAPALSRFAHGQAPVVLKLHHALSPLSSVHTRFLVPWTKKIAADSGNRIRIDLFAAMQLGGMAAELYDQARDGVADIVWTMPGLNPGRFPAVETFELPFIAGRRALANAKAAQDFAELHLKDEFRAVQPLCVTAHDHALIHATRPVGAMDDLKGLKLRAPTRLAGEALKALGAETVTIPLPQLAQSFSAKAIDGCVLSWDRAAIAKVPEIVKFHTDAGRSPALSTSVFILAMNRAKYASLPVELKKVIDDNSADAAAGMLGQMWDMQAATTEEAARKRGNNVGVLTAAEAGRWRKATEPVVAAWVKQVGARYLDGNKLIDSARSLVRKHEAEAQATVDPVPACEQWCPSP